MQDFHQTVLILLLVNVSSCCNANCKFMNTDLALNDVLTPSTKLSINLLTGSFLTNKVWDVSVVSYVFRSEECLSAGVVTDWLWQLEFKVGVLALSFPLFWLFTSMEFCSLLLSDIDWISFFDMVWILIYQMKRVVCCCKMQVEC